MAVKVIDEPCQERRGLDFATAVFVSASAKHQRRTFDRVLSVVEAQTSGLRWQELGRSPHFERVFTHDIGARVEMTELDGGQGRNPGMTVLSLPGAFFYTASAESAVLALWQVCHTDGFKWFTRLDFQNTELSPAWDMDRVYRAISDGELWVKGYGTRREEGDVLPDGTCPTGRTVYWGSRRSERIGRTYDKARQLEWPIPAIRDEVQLRGEWAHSFGRQLKADLASHRTSPEMVSAVERLTVSALNQHLSYMELNGADPKTDKNWLRKAKPADWYQARIGKHCEPLRKDVKDPLELEAAVRYGIRTYGRSFALWGMRQVAKGQMDVSQVLERLAGLCMARLKPDDLDWIMADLSEAELAEHKATFRLFLDRIAVEEEMEPEAL
jgi:hypothetical protein